MLFNTLLVQKFSPRLDKFFDIGNRKTKANFASRPTKTYILNLCQKSLPCRSWWINITSTSNYKPLPCKYHLPCFKAQAQFVTWTLQVCRLRKPCFLVFLCRQFFSILFYRPTLKICEQYLPTIALQTIFKESDCGLVNVKCEQRSRINNCNFFNYKKSITLGYN